MKTGHLIVDGIDVYKEYGVYIVSGGYNGLLSFPPLKKVNQNDWQEYDGIDVDLSAPVLDTRDVSIKFAVRNFSGIFSFIHQLSDGAYHTFFCREIGRQYTLRLTQQPNLKNLRLLGHTTLKFADDFPMNNYSYREPVNGIADDDNYKLDGTPFTKYGIYILNGSIDEITKSAQVKTNLLRNIPTNHGVQYDDKNVTYKSKDIKLNCLMRASSLRNLWHNYDSLLYDLVRPNEHMLWVGEVEQTFPFMYKSGQVSKFYSDGRIWLQFSLTLTITRSLRIIELVLSSENGDIMILEDGETAIDLYKNDDIL